MHCSLDQGKLLISSFACSTEYVWTTRKLRLYCAERAQLLVRVVLHGVGDKGIKSESSVLYLPGPRTDFTVMVPWISRNAAIYAIHKLGRKAREARISARAPLQSTSRRLEQHRVTNVDAAHTLVDLHPYGGVQSSVRRAAAHLFPLLPPLGPTAAPRESNEALALFLFRSSASANTECLSRIDDRRISSFQIRGSSTQATPLVEPHTSALQGRRMDGWREEDPYTTDNNNVGSREGDPRPRGGGPHIPRLMSSPQANV
ncbi:hypothetical protein MYCTH_2108128 [Thermothelomyces thermophilus ATCC 42464]|uniref:Uncharacterized protein n=1 Tax=Thermothelomyces thermophilus (strain ATCC 42464 / BCRC 31852 / DSM 1799) TaxID=573729 RepID=G2Q5Q9_THET4|nr:uncharacterized protein MYCTH_2108128 [Thermothelomyces thermophilus ATCC 42464]AEO55495.1 hypothetical protein MYCTH_2108128 [Thermothelomyces thermophilus ATCC 42464]